MAKKTLASEALKEGEHDLRTEFLGYASSAEAVEMTLDREINMKTFESVHDPDEDQDLIYIETHTPISFTKMALEASKHTSSGVFKFFHEFKGKTDPNFKVFTDFLARSKLEEDPTYLLDEIRFPSAM